MHHWRDNLHLSQKLSRKLINIQVYIVIHNLWNGSISLGYLVRGTPIPAVAKQCVKSSVLVFGNINIQLKGSDINQNARTNTRWWTHWQQIQIQILVYRSGLKFQSSRARHSSLDSTTIYLSIYEIWLYNAIYTPRCWLCGVSPVHRLSQQLWEWTIVCRRMYIDIPHQHQMKPILIQKRSREDQSRVDMDKTTEVFPLWILVDLIVNRKHVSNLTTPKPMENYTN